MTDKIRIVIADDERPARSFLAAMLRSSEDVDLIGEAADGAEAVRMIEQLRPDLALLDLQMPELDGLAVVTKLSKESLPLVAFVTAYDEHALIAFELNAIDYLLKPVEPRRLRRTLMRAHERLERADLRPAENERLLAAATSATPGGEGPVYLRRIPVRKRDDIVIVAVTDIASIVADGELLYLTTAAGDRHTITYRLKDLEARLDPATFVRLSRGAIVNLNTVQRVSPMPGGTYVVSLANGQRIPVSRIRARALRDSLFRL
jgi:two-component system LytT family response regulator